MFVLFAYILWFFFIFSFNTKNTHTHIDLCVSVCIRCSRHIQFAFLGRSSLCIRNNRIQNNRLKNQKKRKERYSEALTERNICLRFMHALQTHKHISVDSYANTATLTMIAHRICSTLSAHMMYGIQTFDSVIIEIHIFMWNFDNFKWSAYILNQICVQSKI